MGRGEVAPGGGEEEGGSKWCVCVAQGLDSFVEMLQDLNQNDLKFSQSQVMTGRARTRDSTPAHL